MAVPSSQVTKVSTDSPVTKASKGNASFSPALVVVDFQEDFCPPAGALAVEGGRDIAPAINSLLSLPGFTIRIATKDFHPQDHVSFASNHPAPDNKPYESNITIANPENPAEVQTTRLWPDHCVQGTKGAELVPELDTDKLDHTVEKGKDSRVEMFSAFYAGFQEPQIANSGLAEMLREKGVTHVYCVGLAYDYCVKCTAIDAASEGFETYVVEEACRAVDASKEAHEAVAKDFQKHGVKVVSMDGEEVQRVRKIAS